MNILGQRELSHCIKAPTEEGETRDVFRGTAGRCVEASIGDGWRVYLETRTAALDWLAPKNRNVGTLVTTEGVLFHSENDVGKKDAASITLGQVLDKLHHLSLLLSFANGGYLAPLYVEATNRSDSEDGRAEGSACVVTPEITPLELIGYSWLTIDSDLEGYIQLLPNVESMLKAPPWNEVFDLVLTWYFQAMQPQSAQMRGKTWPVVANALGAALERVADAILVKELVGRLARLLPLFHQVGATSP